MKASHVWFGFVLVVVGVCGILDATGLVDSSQTIGQWWPLAIVGWALVEMLAARHVSFGGVVCAAVGLALLADEQGWASEPMVWSGLAVGIGLAILVRESAARLRGDAQNGANAPANGALDV